MSSLTNPGEQACLKGSGFSNTAAKLKLYDNTSVPTKSGVEGGAFVEVANGHGYTTGGQAIVDANWTASLVSTTKQIALATFTWTASGGNIANIAGAYITDSSNNVLAWFSRPTLTALSGDVITVSGLTITG